MAESRGELGLVGHESCAVLDYLGDSTPVTVEKPLDLAGPADERAVVTNTLCCEVELGVELGLYLEHLPEILLVVGR